MSESGASARLQLLIRSAVIGATLLGLGACAGTNSNLGTVRPVPITHDNFALADANHDGKLSRREAAEYLVYVVFTASDTNADGQLTAQEWMQNDPAAIAAFRQNDANGDGIVTRAEAIAYSHRDQAGVALMRQADRNRDGKLNRAEIDAYFIRVAGLRG